MWILVAFSCGALAQRVVRVPAPEGAGDRRDDYFLDVLELALAQTAAEDGPVLVQRAPQPMPVQSRGIRALERGKGLDVIWTMTTPEREEMLQPVRIPLLKGLLGWRLLLINREDQPRFSQVQTLEDLRGFVAGLGEDWPDVRIMQSQRLPVVTGRSYNGLFRMLVKKRFDYFPRSVAEIFDERAALDGEDVVIEKHLMLYYPAAIYFFVNKEQEALAARLERGLRRAIADGSRDELFERHFGEVLVDVRRGERTVLKLRNPSLPPDVPIHDPSLWLPVPGR